MKNKKITIGITIAIILVLSIGIYYFLNKEDKNTSLSILEKQWLENNKSKIIDLSILTNIPVINYNGSGILFDFIEELEEVTGLEFNKIAYASGEEIKTEYRVEMVEKSDSKDILLYHDTYALLTKNKIKYNNLSDIKNMNIGVLASDLEKTQNVLAGETLTFTSYETLDAMINAMQNDQTLNAIVLPKLSNLQNIITNENLNISYNITELTQDFVIKLGSNEKLNDIIIKYYEKWKSKKYEESYSKHFSNNYFSFSNIDDRSKAEFKSKRYTYGFVENKPYDTYVNANYYGINKAFIESFEKIANIDIDYKEYDTFGSLIEGFNKSEIDIFFNNTTSTEFAVESTDLVSNYDEQITILASPNNAIVVNSVKSLANSEVMTIENSMISEYLNSNGVIVKTYSDIEKLMENVNKNSIIALDVETYNYYSNKGLSHFKSLYTLKLDKEYDFKVRNIQENQTFINYYNFYLTYLANKEVANNGYSELIGLTEENNTSIKIIIAISSVLIVSLISVLVIQNTKTGKKNKIKISKDSKIRYIDMLTSLKNRAYLNDNMEKWDESGVYPQSIIIVDLNNVAYINDNYGHTEGDKLIKEAANILIKSQMPNSEIIRTNGNEFLIYLIGYEEKQIVAYIRKLNKEFKDLSHNFGAAMGYSMIVDEIKTVDDAINEATLDMRANKEENN